MRQLKISQSITNRDSQALDKYLNDISKIPMISPDEEVTLTRLIRAGDQAALDKLARSNLRFVVSVSKKFQNQGLTLNDLISEGNLGLIKAAKRFDETKGFKFISYAVWWIRQAIMQAIAEQSRMVRLPLNQVGSLTRLHKTFARLEQEYQRDPSLEELADAMEKSADSIADVISKSGRHLSVDAPFVNGEENSLLDVPHHPWRQNRRYSDEGIAFPCHTPFAGCTYGQGAGDHHAILWHRSGRCPIAGRDQRTLWLNP